MRQENNDSPCDIFKAPDQGLLLKKINRRGAELTLETQIIIHIVEAL
jgi:hypothetical protein